MLRSSLHAAVLAATCFASVVPAANLRVPQQFPTIQSAINGAADGDTVIVAPSTYVENLLITRPLTLRSSTGAEGTTIDGGSAGPVIVARGSGAEVITIAGFTITNGFNTFVLPGGEAPARAAGIVAESVSITIRDNIIRNNDGCIGTGISTTTAAVTIQHNTIVDNTRRPECDGADGGGMFLNGDGAGPSLVAANVIARHRIGGRGAGMAIQGMNDITVRDNLFSANEANSEGGGSGGGIFLNIGSARILNNILVGNSAQIGGAMALAPIDNANHAVVEGNLMSGNSALLQGSAVHLSTVSQEGLLFAGNVIEGNSPFEVVYCGGLSYILKPSNLLRNSGGPLVGGACTP